MGKNLKSWLFYLAMILTFILLTYLLFNKASVYNSSQNVFPQLSSTPEFSNNFDNFLQSVKVNFAEPLALLLLQIIAILIVSRIFSFFFKKIGQPTVIGEILAGIALGPSLLGLFFPDAFHFLFADQSLEYLHILSQVGLVLFMFTIGMELNIDALKNRMGTTFIISNSSIIIPYFLGMLLAYFLFEEFAAGHTNFLSFALFLGISLSITAFPVLARIVQERGLTRTHLGTVSIASAAFDDVTAWCILAAVVAIAKTGSLAGSIYTLGLAVAYVLFMMLIMRPFLRKIGQIYHNAEVLNKNIIAFIFLILIASAFITQLIGIHALFGAFLAGVVMPPLPNFRKMIIDKVEDLSLTLLLPLFFVFTGLRTEIGLLNTPHLWFICIIIILTAISGKFVGGAFTARFLGETWKDSLSIGVLMNTRGLMELVVLNIGYEMGILPPAIFAMLVLMALITTFMTSPALSLINRIFPDKTIEAEIKIQQAQGVFKVLIAIGNPKNSPALLNVAKSVLDGSKNSLVVRALHITPGTDTNPIYSEQFANESFKGIIEESEKLNLPLETEYKITDNVESGVVKIVNTNFFDFLLVGAGISLSGIQFFNDNVRYSNNKLINKFLKSVRRSQTIFYPGGLIKDKTKYFIENSKCSVGVFVNRGFTTITTTVVLLNSPDDIFLLRYARRLMRNKIDASVFIIELNKITQTNAEVQQYMNELKLAFPVRFKQLKSSKNNAALISKFSFMLISYTTWNLLSESDRGELSQIPSTLIINKKPSRFTLQKSK
jgi:Kef-type K+ transport system membrane component KefB